MRDGRYDVRVFYPEHQTADVEYTHGEYEIDGVKVLNLKETPHFKVRVTMDVDEPEQKFFFFNSRVVGSRR